MLETQATFEELCPAHRDLQGWARSALDFREHQRSGQDLRLQAESGPRSILFNGLKVHTNQPINQVWGGRNSGIDGGNDGGKGITDVPGGLKLQAEGHDVRYRNIWIKELELKEANTDF